MQLLQATADRLAIMEMKARFCRMSDILDVDGMLDVFTDDCEFVYTAGEPPARGKEALRAFYHSEVDLTVSCLHLVSNFEIEFVGPDLANSRCALHSWKRFVNQPEDRRRYAQYIEQWRRTDAGWRQCRLEYVVVGENGTAEDRHGEQLTRPQT
jgi:uncharacterized protein (TIGR02246 family)